MAHLVDTEILIDYLRHQEAAADFPDSLGEWTLSVVSGMELVAGALDNNEVRSPPQRESPGHGEIRTALRRPAQRIASHVVDIGASRTGDRVAEGARNGLISLKNGPCA